MQIQQTINKLKELTNNRKQLFTQNIGNHSRSSLTWRKDVEQITAGMEQRAAISRADHWPGNTEQEKFAGRMEGRHLTEGNSAVPGGFFFVEQKRKRTVFPLCQSVNRILLGDSGSGGLVHRNFEDIGINSGIHTQEQYRGRGRPGLSESLYELRSIKDCPVWQ